MTNLIRILASFVFCLASVSSAWAVTAGNETAHTSVLSASLGKAKDTAGMDALVDSLQGRNMVKAALTSPLLRTRAEDKSAFAAPIAVDRTEESTEVDLRMLMAGLVLVGVIALRRMS
jgi:alpha-D-ribose 1-methylphosphonate 5-triphosphate synthase subunit PhnG